jgi:hypothetical protein
VTGAQLPSQDDRSELATEYSRLWARFVLFVDLYKHHFDLFLKGFVFYLAVQGAVAGFAFSEDTTPETRQALLTLATVMSVFAVATWTVALVGMSQFATTFEELCAKLSVPHLPTFGVKVSMFLCILASLVMFCFGIFLLSGL